jgi:hypothetical protein
MGQTRSTYSNQTGLRVWLVHMIIQLLYVQTVWMWKTLRMFRRRTLSNSCPNRDSNSDPFVIQPVASSYTDNAIPALKL